MMTTTVMWIRKHNTAEYYSMSKEEPVLYDFNYTYKRLELTKEELAETITQIKARKGYESTAEVLWKYALTKENLNKPQQTFDEGLTQLQNTLDELEDKESKSCGPCNLL